MDRILVTGTEGALGWYIKQYLLYGKPIGSSEIAIIGRREIKDPGVKYYRCDLLDQDSVAAVIKDFKPQKAFLIAWETTHGSYWNDQSNIRWADATINFAEKFAEHGGDFLTFAGTCAEYQWSSEIMREDVTPENPKTLYGKEKLRATRHLLDMRDRGKLEANCCRLFFPFSERENENRITSMVIKSVLQNTPIHLRSGDVYRDICHTRHIAQAMCEMSLAGVGGLYNMSTGKPLHLGKFLQKIEKYTGKNNLVTWDGWNDADNTDGEPKYVYGSNEKVKYYLKLPDNTDGDIQTFVQASIERFSRSDR